MVKIAAAVLIGLAVSAPLHAVAQFRYKDDEGITHFVNSMDQVPEQYRKGAVGGPVPPAKPTGIDWERKAREDERQRNERILDEERREARRCIAGFEALAARPGGKFTRSDVRRELGPACEQHVQKTFEQVAEAIKICGERIDTVFSGLDSTRGITKGELLVAAGPGCEKVVDRVWSSLQKDRRR